MTDQELIQLLHEKPSSEFTLEEFEALRARWTQSPELRQALIERLRLETQLTGALGQVELDVDTILKRAADERRKSPNAQSSFYFWRLESAVSSGSASSRRKMRSLTTTPAVIRLIRIQTRVSRRTNTPLMSPLMLWSPWLKRIRPPTPPNRLLIRCPQTR